MKKSVICLILLSVLIIFPPVRANEQGPLEEADVDVSLEFKSNGQFHFNIEAHEGVSIGPSVPIGMSPIDHAEAELDVSSPGPGELDLEANATVTFVENQVTPQMEAMFEMISREKLNKGIPGSPFEGLEFYEGKKLSTILSGLENGIPGGGGPEVPDGEIPQELSDLTIEELTCTSYSWSMPRLSVELAASLSGTVFENEEFRDFLPMDSDFSMDFSNDNLILSFDMNSQKGEVDFDMSSGISGSTQIVRMTLDGYLELSTDGDNIEFDMDSSSLENVPDQAFQTLEEMLEDVDVSLTVKVPSGANVSGMPSGYEKDGSEYNWTGEDARNAISAVSTGQSEPGISYEGGGTGGESDLDDGLPYLWIGVGAVFIVLLVALGVISRL